MTRPRDRSSQSGNPSPRPAHCFGWLLTINGSRVESWWSPDYGSSTDPNANSTYKFGDTWYTYGTLDTKIIRSTSVQGETYDHGSGGPVFSLNWPNSGKVLAKGLIKGALNAPFDCENNNGETCSCTNDLFYYSQVFDAEFNEAISSFQFGAWNTDSFFLLTIEEVTSERPGGGSCFGFFVDDLEAAHQLALAAGATEIHPPMEFEWKPRTSVVDDPSGNRISLTQR